MSAGATRLVVKGEEDKWLTGQPDFSFFRSAFRRPTHYSNSVEHLIIGGNPAPSGYSVIKFEKKGDLLSYVYLTMQDNYGAQISNVNWSNVIDRAEFLVGGQIIDTQDFTYMTEIEPATGAVNYGTRYLNNAPSGPTNQNSSFFPFKFCFCKNYMSVIPLVALQFHEVELVIYWSSNLNSKINIGPTTQPVVTSLPVSTVVVSSAVYANPQWTIALSSFTGIPLYPGMLISTSLTPDNTNSGTIQYLSINTGSPNPTTLVFTFPTGTGITQGTTLYIWEPNVSAVSVSSTGNTIQLGNTATGTGAINVGDFVTGTYVTYVNGTAVTVKGSPPANGTALGFFSGTASGDYRYSDMVIIPWANYIYLEDEERKRIASSQHDILITQVSRINMATDRNIQEFSLAHPVKFIAWPAVNYQTIYANGSNSLVASKYTIQEQINGFNCGDPKHLPYYTDVSKYYNCPMGYVADSQVSNVGIISYALDTSSHGPTGTLNFSQLDTYRLITSSGLSISSLGRGSNPYFYAVNYNILRISKGMGGILYS